MSINPAPPIERYLVLGYLRGLFDYVRARRAPIDALLEMMGLTEHDLRDPDLRVAHAKINDIFAVAEQITHDVNVGLHAGEATHLMHFGIIGQLAMTCRTARELVDLQSRYHALLGNGARMSYFEVGDELVGELTVEDGTPLSRHAFEYSMTSHLTLARLMAGFPVSCARVEVTYDAPEDRSEQDRVLGCPVVYNTPHLRTFLPTVLLDIPLILGDGSSRAALELEARRRLDALQTPMSDNDPQVAAVMQHIAAHLNNGSPNLDHTAVALGVSVRTLQRRLDAQNVTYRDLVDRVRQRLAQRYLGDAALSQVDICVLLGFSDQSAFHKAFRKWFGMTPGEYRSQQSQPGAR